MPKSKLIAATLFASLLVPAALRAAPLDPTYVPADAKWVVHVDMDAARSTKTWDAVGEKLFADGNARDKIDQIEQLTGMKVPDDLHDVTVYGKEAGDAAGVVIVHAKIDRKQTMASLQFAKEFGTADYGNYKVLTWYDTDKDQKMYGAFHDDKTVILGQVEKNIQSTLDAMDGKVETIKPESSMAAGVKPGVLVSVAARDVATLHEPDAKPNPVVASVDTVWIAMTEKDDTVTVRSELGTKSPETAKNLQSSLNGLKAMVGLIGAGDNADPVVKAGAAATKTLATSLKDNTVVVEWPMPVDQVTAMIKAVAEKQGLKN